MTRIGLVAQISRLRLAAVLGALGALSFVSPAGADEAKTPINASLFLSIMSAPVERREAAFDEALKDRKSTRLNSSHSQISYAVFCLKKKKKRITTSQRIM